MWQMTLALVLALSTAGSLQSQGNSGLKGKPEDNSAATRKYLMSLAWGDDLDSASVVEAPFTWGNNTAMIRVVPMRTANMVDWFSALAIGKPGGNGYFVAKIYNLEDKEIGPLGLDKLGTGYLWVGEISGAAGTRGAAVYTLKNNGKVDGNPKTLALGGFCPGQHSDSRVELTNGKKCPTPFQPLSRSENSPQIMLASMHTTVYFAGGGLWVTCLGGCCELQTAH